MSLEGDLPLTYLTSVEDGDGSLADQQCNCTTPTASEGLGSGDEAESDLTRDDGTNPDGDKGNAIVEDPLGESQASSGFKSSSGLSSISDQVTVISNPSAATLIAATLPQKPPAGPPAGKKGAGKRKTKASANDGRVFEGEFTLEFWTQVQEKQDVEGLPKKIAIREARIDRIIAMNGRSAELGLFAALQGCYTQGEGVQLTEGIMARGVDLTSREDYPADNPLHICAKRNFVYVARLLLDGGVPTDAVSEDGRLPIEVAFDERNDEVAGLIIKQMSKTSVRRLFESQVEDCRPGRSYYELVDCGKMTESCRAILDACLESTDEPDEKRFHYTLLESDSTGLLPDHQKFNQSRTTFHRILENGRKELIYHNVFRMLIHNKWTEYGEGRARVNLLIYLAFLVCFTVALVLAVGKPDPSSYSDYADYGRGILEVVSVIAVLIDLYQQVETMIRDRIKYWKGPYNYLQLASIGAALLIIPLRFTDQRAQWYFACLAYLLFTLRVLKLISITRIVGIYMQILTRILAKDVSRFGIIFSIFTLAYAGALVLALRADPHHDDSAGNSTSPYKTTKLALSPLTRNYHNILLTGIRTMIQQENIAPYVGDEEDDGSFGWLGVLVNMVFLFFVLIVLLNILIAQLSATYADVQADAQRELEQNWGLALKELEKGPLKGKRLAFFDRFEDVENPQEFLLGWEEIGDDSDSGAGDGEPDENEARRQRQMEQSILRQQQQISSLKSQMKLALELLRANEKEHPRVHAAINNLGHKTIPATFRSILDEQAANAPPPPEPAQASSAPSPSVSGLSGANLALLQENISESTTHLSIAMKQSEEEVAKRIEHRLTQTSAELREIREVLEKKGHPPTVAYASRPSAEDSGELQEVLLRIEKAENDVFASLGHLHTRFTELAAATSTPPKYSTATPSTSLQAEHPDIAASLTKFQQDLAWNVAQQLDRQQQEMKRQLSSNLAEILAAVTRRAPPASHAGSSSSGTSHTGRSSSSAAPPGRRTWMP